MNELASNSMPAIMYETGDDEAFLVGTKDEIKAFARALLDALQTTSESQNYLGISCKSIKTPSTETWGYTCIEGLIVTESVKDKKKLINAIRKNNGEPQVQVDGWPQIE